MSPTDGLGEHVGLVFVQRGRGVGLQSVQHAGFHHGLKQLWT